ncbi:hypothetical protein [Georgenia sp. AZ-5]
MSFHAAFATPAGEATAVLPHLGLVTGVPVVDEAPAPGPIAPAVP